MKKEILYEGKAKKVFKTDNPEFFVIEYKDDATAFDGKKRGTINNKGVLNNKISAIFFELLQKHGIETHFVRLLSEREMLVRAVGIIPIEVIVRNIVAGSLSKRLGLEEGTILKKTVLELCYKNDELSDPMINRYHALAMELATEEELNRIEQTALKVNEIMKNFLGSKNIILVDFKLEFGRANGKILLADEISPDTCRFWDGSTREKLDKDRFRRDLGNVEQAYWEIYKRISEE
ncbi:MAG: phosphoribosylaminoimidazole-succinocarboxamide synthase [Pseudothermotoga sp.]|jgi:phosphoribosylaminoimidazole-succinocarboxamide synthase|uniref:phosphoribosylaminoimidazolesuccinocarboxamide synthase n=1 Tax=Pseudothermotoga TaxID=1643951 RepID=UPI000748450F|nr:MULTISPECIES: phosphoribosylaminoimidazolesuccinocarboxamide synthase [Pseudothermotoga]KUK21858.1 MAG: Phosphoribosylaminoimidazole-succinocarboxamide synthase [Pseudothermotoga lettingae]MDI3494882.1 phosphoribosylaminoimidazole-succinocarboxamide synthase [Pseudothermotoga sp.]HBJ80426.1 phosphoribosylaminoimidazolesuccinocarboxamide synthase [Pseudothermotoga sp.]HBT25982.1 phosphoribosylaminoimidazolesuccinocarboxamide synthase [Pseudothermotoga sp.]